MSIADERDLFVLDKFSRKLIISIPEAKAESGKWSVVKSHQQPEQPPADHDPKVEMSSDQSHIPPMPTSPHRT